MVMWTGGTFVMMLAFVFIVFEWWNQEEKRAKAREAREDAALAAR